MLNKRKKYKGSAFTNKTSNLLARDKNIIKKSGQLFNQICYKIKIKYYQMSRKRYLNTVRKTNLFVTNTRAKSRNFKTNNFIGVLSNKASKANFYLKDLRDFLFSTKLSKSIIITSSSILIFFMVFGFMFMKDNNRNKSQEYYTPDNAVAETVSSHEVLQSYNDVVDTISIYSEPNKMMLASPLFTQTSLETNYIDSFYDTLSDDHTLSGDGVIGVEYNDYEIQSGDNLSTLSLRIGATLDTIVSVNKISNAHKLMPGDSLSIPNRNGLLYTVKKNETLDEVSEKYEISVDRIISFNRIENSTDLLAGTDLFLPGARYTLEERIDRFGQFFILPIGRVYRISSAYGYRRDPVTGARRVFHKGVDMPGPLNSPIYAARGGTIIFAGWNGGYGNTIIIRHKDGYTSYYAHLNRITTAVGRKVAMGQQIGKMGSTGKSTGSHIHFEIRKYGVAINPSEYIPFKKYLKKR